MKITTYSSSRLPRFTQILAILYHPYLCLWLMDLNISTWLNQLNSSRFKNRQKPLEIASVPPISALPWRMMAVVHTAEVRPSGKASAPSSSRATSTMADTNSKVLTPRPRPGTRRKKTAKNWDQLCVCLVCFLWHVNVQRYVQSFLFFEVYSKCLSTGLSTTVYTNIYSYLLYVSVAKCWDSIQPSTLLHPPWGAPESKPFVRCVSAARARGM